MILAGFGRLLSKTAEGFGRHTRPVVVLRYTLLVGSDVACKLKALYWFLPLCSRLLASRSVYLHPSMHIRSIAGPAMAKMSGDPIWIDCDAGSDDALGTNAALNASSTVCCGSRLRGCSCRGYGGCRCKPGRDIFCARQYGKSFHS